MAGFGIGNIIGGIGGGIAGLLGSGPTVTTGSQSSSGTSDINTNSNTNSDFEQWLKSYLESVSHTTGGGTSTSTSTPNISPQTQALIDNLTNRYQSLTAPSLGGYEAQQTQAINRNADLQSQAAQQMMASRGLASSPAASTTLGNIDAQRFGNINTMQAGLPILKNQMDLSNLGAAAGFMNMIPHSTTTTGSNTNVSDTTQNQNQGQTSGGSSNTGSTGYQQALTSNNSNSTQTQQQKGSAAAGITGLLAGLFSDENLKEEIKDNPSDKAVERIMALRPVEWKWKGGEFEDRGLLAQDVQKSHPSLVNQDEETGFLKVNYTGLIGDLVSAVQALNLKGA